MPKRLSRHLIVILGLAAQLGALEARPVSASESPLAAPAPPAVRTVLSAGEPLDRGFQDCQGPHRPSGLDATRTANNPAPFLAPLPALSPFSAPAPVPRAPDHAQAEVKALILYDAVPGDAYGKLGITYAIMLRNLLGHFGMGADLVPIDRYSAGQLENYPATFYLGSFYNDPVPSSFMTDVMSTRRTVVWFKENLWKLAWDPQYGFTQKFGFRFLDLKGLDAKPDPSHPDPGFFDTVLYKGEELTKYYSYDPKSDEVEADPDLGLTQVTDPSKASVLVTIRDGKSGASAPYIIRSGNFWYVADVPFTYIGPRDRYLVICDILHDMLGIQHAERHRALVRLEDVSASVDPASMKTLSDYLSAKSIPFSIATIPFYRDPLGRYDHGTPQEIHLKDATALLQSLAYASAHGGAVLMHGYTHQYGSVPNVATGVSADDFEFWNAVKNAPVDEDSYEWAAGRLDAGLAELAGAGYRPFAWEAPHYQGSPSSYRAFADLIPNTYQRVVYYSSDAPNLDPLDPERDFMAGQFFPYVIDSDYYGERVIPEDLGNIEYDIHDTDPNSNITYTWKDILTNARYARVVRDGFASFFFHPFWVEPGFADLHALADFENLVDGITSLGYTWAAAKDL